MFGSILVSCGQEEPSGIDTTSEEVTPPDGELLFLNNCASCHGTDGTAGISDAKDLSVTELNRQAIQKIVKEGRKSMPPFEHILSEEGEMDAVVDYVESLKKN